MQFEYLTYSKESHIVTLTLNRPERLNSISPPMNLELWEALNTFREDKDAWVCILTGAGDRAFCAGNDIVGPSKPLSQNSQHQVKLQIGSGPIGLHKLITTIKDFPKPTVVLMQGFALGAGYDLATSCDIRVATTDCKIGDPRVHRAPPGA